MVIIQIYFLLWYYRDEALNTENMKDLIFYDLSFKNSKLLITVAW